MKSLMIAFLLVSAQSFAAQNHEVINTTTTVLVQDNLRCVITAGEGNVSQRTFSVMGDQLGRGLKIGNTEGVELDHKLAAGLGCNQAALDQLVVKSKMSYGYKSDVPVQVIKDTSESRVNGYGQCLATYQETLVIDLGSGIALKSTEAEWRPMNDCK